jgi:starvation-inducible DNA-binding protein
MEIEIGLTKKIRQEMGESLRDLLANTYALYLKTQNFHWNVIGSEFFSLHLLFENQYEALAEAVDEIAERVRSLGIYADGSFSAFGKRATIADSNKILSDKKMIEELVKGHEEICRQGRPLITRSQDLHDDVTGDLVIKRLSFHEKAAWMLRSHLECVK